MDSIDFPVNHQAGIFSEIINYSGENGYIFYAVSFDKFGNRSVTSEIAAILLRNRDISTAGAMDDGTLTIQWGDNIQYVDYCKLSYINQVGLTVYQKVFPSEKTTVIRDYSSDLSFSTLCTLLPSMTDTFRMETVFPAVIESTPFKGPHILSSSAPYSLFTMDFDYGGEGIAFHDLSVNPPTDPNYRKNEGDELSSAVTIDVVGNCVGWFTSGEWLVYTIEVRDPGVYALDMRMAVGAIDGRFYVSMDGNRSETVTTPVIGGWGDYAWLFERFPHLKQPTFRLTAGKHKFRFTALGWPFNINIFKFTYTGE
jgi:hypothetical protein